MVEVGFLSNCRVDFFEDLFTNASDFILCGVYACMLVCSGNCRFAIRAISVSRVKFNVEFTSQALNFSIERRLCYLAGNTARRYQL